MAPRLHHFTDYDVIRLKKPLEGLWQLSQFRVKRMLLLVRSSYHYCYLHSRWAVPAALDEQFPRKIIYLCEKNGSSNFNSKIENLMSKKKINVKENLMSKSI